MNKPEVSIVLPAIRQERWDALYDSILLACKKYTFELIICGPLPLTPHLHKRTNVKYAKDLGSQVRASNIAASLAEGKLITWIADDAVMFPDSLDKNIDLLYEMGNNYKNVVIMKYIEGKNGTEKINKPDSYFEFKNTDFNLPNIPSEWILFNNPLMTRAFYEEIGGLDNTFETCPVAHTDFAARAQNLGAKVKISPIFFLDCDHMEGMTGDHMPIHIGQLYFDTPKFIEKYSNPNWRDKTAQNILLDSWKKESNIWKRRFKSMPSAYSDILTLSQTPDYNRYSV